MLKYNCVLISSFSYNSSYFFVLFDLGFFFETDISIHICVYICMYMCVYLNIYPDNPPASASRVLDYRCVPPRLAIAEASKKNVLIYSLTAIFQTSFPKTEANTADRGRDESNLWRVLRTCGAHRLKHEATGREIPFPWEINKLNQMEINLIFSFSPYYPNWFNFVATFQHSYNE